MNNVFVYCEIEGTQVQEVSQELLTKGRKLANEQPLQGGAATDLSDGCYGYRS